MHTSVRNMTVTIGAQLRKGVVEYCVLGALARESMYGWNLSEELTSRGVIASIGTLYPLLARLRAQGLVDAIEQKSPGGQSRKYYHLTPAGTARLQDFREQWEPFARTVHELVADVRDDPAADAANHG